VPIKDDVIALPYRCCHGHDLSCWQASKRLEATRNREINVPASHIYCSRFVLWETERGPKSQTDIDYHLSVRWPFSVCTTTRQLL